MTRPMTDQAFYILLSLVEGPSHGYGIVGKVASLSEGQVSLKVGSLYGVLDRLVSDGRVEFDREEIFQGRARRYYRLTEDGAAALDQETERRTTAARLAAKHLRPWRAARAGGIG